MARVFIACRIFPEVLEMIRASGHGVEMYPGDVIPREELGRRIVDTEALICPLSLRVDRELLEGAQKLRVVANLGVGVDNIDLEAATSRGIAVLNTPGVLSETVADLAFGLILAVARRICEVERVLRSRGFPGWSFMPDLMGTDVYGATLGIVGLGRIGTAIARRAGCFGMRILYHSRTRKPGLEAELSLEYRPLEELLGESDFVVLSVPLTPGTRHLIGARELSLMKRTAYLVNIARGAVVDEEALVRALKEGWIAGAALDVFEHEPEVHPELLRMENVVLTPHIGSATVATRRRMAELAARGVLAVLQGRRPPNLVNPRAWPPGR